jgi:hypothetical protein
MPPSCRCNDLNVAFTPYVLVRTLPSRFASSAEPSQEPHGPQEGYALSLRVPLLLATAGYLVAIALAWITLRDR